MRKYFNKAARIAVSLALVFSMSIPMVTYGAEEVLNDIATDEIVTDEYWDAELYAQIENTVMDNVPQVLDQDGEYIYKTNDGIFYDVFDITSEAYEEDVRTIEETYRVKGNNEEERNKFQRVTYYGDAIAHAISDANAAGGGTVLIPEGTYWTGAIRFKDNVRLHLEEGATLQFVRNKTNEYYPLEYSRWESMDVINFSGFLYSIDVENIAVTGTGTLDGMVDTYNWMPWKTNANNGDVLQAYVRDSILQKWVDNGTPVEERVLDDTISTLRPNFITFVRTNNILMSDFKIRNSPMWEVSPLLSENILIDGLDINSKRGNNDGVDPESCTNVIIQNCDINTGDDCIAIKAGRNNDGRTESNKPCTNLIIRYNIFRDGHGGITAGSEMSGGVMNVLAHENKFDSVNLDYAIRFKTNTKRGGYIKNIYVKDSKVNKCKVAVIHCEFFYETQDLDAYMPEVSNIRLSNITTLKTDEGGSNNIGATNLLYLQGYAFSPVNGVYLKDCEFNGIGNTLLNVYAMKNVVFDNVTVNKTTYIPSPNRITIKNIYVDGIEVKENGQELATLASTADVKVVFEYKGGTNATAALFDAYFGNALNYTKLTAKTVSDFKKVDGAEDLYEFTFPAQTIITKNDSRVDVMLREKSKLENYDVLGYAVNKTIYVPAKELEDMTLAELLEYAQKELATSGVYTDSSLEDLEDAVEAALLSVNDPNPEVVENMRVDLLNVIKALQLIDPKEIVTLDELKELVAKARLLADTVGIHTEHSRAKLAELLDEIEPCLEDEPDDDTRKSFKEAINDLIDKLEVVVVPVDKNALSQLIYAASILLSDDYTSQSWTEMQFYLDFAKSIYEYTASQQDEVDEIVAELQARINDLVDLKLLKEAIGREAGLESADYTLTSWYTAQIAWYEAKAVLAKEDAAVAEVTAATDKLNTTFNNLVLKVKKDKLKLAIENAASQVTTSYTTLSVLKMKLAINDAQKVYNGAGYTQAEVDAAADALDKAVQALVIQVNRTDLKGLITKMSAIPASNYTFVSWYYLRLAISEATIVANDANATQAQVDAQVESLNAAEAALVLK